MCASTYFILILSHGNCVHTVWRAGSKLVEFDVSLSLPSWIFDSTQKVPSKRKSKKHSTNNNFNTRDGSSRYKHATNHQQPHRGKANAELSLSCLWQGHKRMQNESSNRKKEILFFFFLRVTDRNTKMDALKSLKRNRDLSWLNCL